MPFQPFLGQIMPFAGSRAPNNWAFCNGQLLAITTNSALFSLLGTYFGGDGIRTFALPDLRGRAILGAGQSGGNVLGTTSGTITVGLNSQQIPVHNHVIQATTASGAGRGAAPKNNLFAVNTLPANNPTKIFLPAGSAETPLAAGTNVVNDGGGQPHNNVQPYLAISYVIALNGVFPSRN